jgi:hypothetical protein
VMKTTRRGMVSMDQNLWPGGCDGFGWNLARERAGVHRRTIILT